MKAAFVTEGDPFDVRRWSGLYYYIAKALADQGIVVDPIGPLHRKYETLLKCKEAVFRYGFRRRHPRDREPVIAKHYARQILERLRPDHDFVFSVGTLAIPYLDCPQPIFFWSDATFDTIVDFYPMYSNLARETIRTGNALEEAALRRSRLAIYSSDWAAASAISRYGMDPQRVAVVPFGSNLDIEVSHAEAEAAVAARDDALCRLLFIGVEWERKGGPLTIEIAKALNESGRRAELDVVGPWPRGEEAPPFVNRLGFVDKGTREGQEQLRQLLLRSHFLLLPSRAECSAVVLSEAAAHAVPVVATNVGGLPTIVRDGINGMLFERDASALEYAIYIDSVLSLPDRYRQLALSSYAEWCRRLNWQVGGAAVRALIETALDQS
jgi:glycosyltransferase involved in cell wall biosynthesis